MKSLFEKLEELSGQDSQMALTTLNASELMTIQGGNGGSPIFNAASIFTHCAIYHTFESFYNCINAH